MRTTKTSEWVNVARLLTAWAVLQARLAVTRGHGDRFRLQREFAREWLGQ
jgi:hypothetical protein